MADRKSQFLRERPRRHVAFKTRGKDIKRSPLLPWGKDSMGRARDDVEAAVDVSDVHGHRIGDVVDEKPTCLFGPFQRRQ